MEERSDHIEIGTDSEPQVSRDQKTGQGHEIEEVGVHLATDFPSDDTDTFAGPMSDTPQPTWKSIAVSRAYARVFEDLINVGTVEFDTEYASGDATHVVVVDEMKPLFSQPVDVELDTEYCSTVIVEGIEIRPENRSGHDLFYHE